MDILDYAFMQRALLAAVLVGITAPAVGIYLVQRRQALMGDGIGHVAMTGVGLGFLLSWSPVWMATAVSVLGAVLMELIRWYGRTRGDIALAMLFYGGMAGGVMLINLAPGGSNANLTSYLFGSLSTVSESDVTAICVLAAFVVLVTLGLRRQLFAVSQDEEFARVTGLPVRALNLLTAVTAAVTVTVAMRVVGLLLVSALMVVPVAAAQQLGRSFAATFAFAVVIGVSVTIGGTVTSYYQDVPPGATIVLLTIAVFVVLTALATPLARRRTRRAEGGAKTVAENAADDVTEAPAGHRPAWTPSQRAGSPEPPEETVPAMRVPPSGPTPGPAQPGLAQWPRETQT
jgi:zinc transport system permease protein